MDIELWIPLTLAAAFFQNLRFMLQKRLSGTQSADGGLSATGATFARFIYSAPLVGLLMAGYMGLGDLPFPVLSGAFWIYAGCAAVTQILATVCVVVLFSRRNFAVGVTLKKSEVLQTGLVGFVVLGEVISPSGIAALMLGLVAVLILTDAKMQTTGWGRFFNPSAGLGLLSGAFFAVAGVCVRGATLELPQDDLLVRAGISLLVVTGLQVGMMLVWFGLRDRGQIGRVLRLWRMGVLVGITSLLGSICWFAAFSLQTVAYVTALGQIEILFSIIGGALVFGERINRSEGMGIGLLMVSLLLLVLFA
ncbi:MAG: drug/metabolite transporter (DMT)-like permease [Paracoccaceae bacterium]|jgi:drug/metabolite transporter (DMT)-like permease